MSDIDTKTILEVAETLTTIKTLFASSEPLLPVYTALGGAFIGAVSGIIPTTITSIIRDRKNKKSVTLAIYSEIKVNIELCEHRKYLNTFKNIIEQLQLNEGATHPLQIEISDDRFQVYKSQLSKLGSLDSNIAISIVRFYQLLEAVIQDVKPGGSLSAGEHGLASYENTLSLAEQAFEVGYETLKLIEIKYGINTKTAG